MAAASVARSGIDATHLALSGIVPLAEPDRIEEGQAAARQAVDAAVELGAPVVYGPTGGAPVLEWDDAAAAFVAAIEPVAAYGRERGSC